jgi:NADH:ubiquinone oxidoreductase subunit 4 (subunit M)
MDFYREHLLSIITYTPLLGAVLLLLPIFRKNDDAVRWFANAVGLVSFW